MEIQLRGGKTITTEGSETIVRAGLRQGLVLAHSCLTGRCNTCKTRVLSGESESILPEIGLTEQEKAEGYILSCVREARTDMRLDVQDLGSVQFDPATIFPAKIQAIEHLTESVLRLVLRFPPSVDFKFIPGQYVNIMKDDYKRSYSIANVIGENGLVLIIKKYENGLFSNFIFNYASVNDLLRVEAPLGTFFMRTDKAKHIVFLATGTGIAPIRSMLDYGLKQNLFASNQRVSLFYGERTEKDLLYNEESFNDILSYFPVLSRPDSDWSGAIGYVQDVAAQTIDDFSACVVYACGSIDMIQNSHILFVKNGLRSDFFYSDAFVTTN